MQASQTCAELGDVQDVTEKPPSRRITVSPFMGGQQNSEIKKSYLFEIPLELLASLLDKYIPHADKLRLRLVHPVLRSLFDTYLGFKVTLDDEDSSQKFYFIADLAIRKTTIGNLTGSTKPRIQRPPRFREIFFYPQLLQEVVFTGNVDVDIFNGIIRHCPALQSLELCPGSNLRSWARTKNNYFKGKNKKPNKNPLERIILPEVDIFSGPEQSPPQNPVYYMTKVRGIKLLLNQDNSEIPDSGNPSDLNTEAVLGVLKSLRSSHLERVVVQGWISARFSVARLTFIAAECLERNSRIESFFLGVIYENLLADDDPIPEGDLKLRALTLEKLKRAGDTINIQKIGISTQSCDIVLWKEFLKRQHNLVHISFTVDLVEGCFSSEMFRSSSSTLRQFILRGKFRTAFDFGWIEDCVNLREICLHNIDHQDQSSMMLHAVNSAAIPDGLESLVLFQTTCRSDDIRAAVRKLKLTTLVLFKTGNNAGETGLNVECLKLIFRCRTLESILLVRFVAPNPVEAAELVKILQTMNDGQISREVYGAEEIQQLIPEPELATPEDTEVIQADPVPLEEEGADADQESEPVEDTPESEGAAGGSMSIKPEIKAPKIAVPEDLIAADECMDIELRDTFISALESINPNEPHHVLDGHTWEEIDTPDDSEASAPVRMEQTLLPERTGDKCVSNEGQMDTASQGGSKLCNSTPPPEKPEEISASPEIQDNNNPIVEPTDADNTPDNQEEASAADGDPSDDEDDDSWEDIDSDSDDDSDEEGVFDLDLDDLNLDVLEQVAGAQAVAGGQGNVQLILNLQNEDDLQEMLGLLEPVAQNANLNNIQFGFILDGVIDIQAGDTKRSRWVAVEDNEGHLTYTLKISID